MLALQDPLGQLPPAASTFAPDVDAVYYLTLWICAFFFVLITGILLYSVVKWRRRTPEQPAASDTTHHTTLEVVWTVIPLIIVMVLFALGWKGGINMYVAPANALQYQVVGKQWEWQITHPDATSPSINEMWVPVGEPVKVTQFSLDVLHSFYIPAMRTKRDVLPGRYQTVWFQAEKLGDYPIMCAEYCGTNHSYMLGTIHVVTRDVYDEQPWNIRPTEPVALGEWTYQGRCKACHSIDGSKGTGPTFKDLWGKTENLADGSTVLVDEAYVKESIKMPQAKIVAGYEGVNMSLFPDIAADEEQLDGIVEYLKTLSSNED